MTYSTRSSPLPLWERSPREARRPLSAIHGLRGTWTPVHRERGRRRRRLLGTRHPLPNPSPIKGEGLKRLFAGRFAKRHGTFADERVT